MLSCFNIPFRRRPQSSILNTNSVESISPHDAADEAFRCSSIPRRCSPGEGPCPSASQDPQDPVSDEEAKRLVLLQDETPYAVTLFCLQTGEILTQNQTSSAYFASLDLESGCLLNSLFMLQPGLLNELYSAVHAGQTWKRVVRVPKALSSVEQKDVTLADHGTSVQEQTICSFNIFNAAVVQPQLNTGSLALQGGRQMAVEKIDEKERTSVEMLSCPSFVTRSNASMPTFTLAQSAGKRHLRSLHQSGSGNSSRNSRNTSNLSKKRLQSMLIFTQSQSLMTSEASPRGSPVSPALGLQSWEMTTTSLEQNLNLDQTESLEYTNTLKTIQARRTRGRDIQGDKALLESAGGSGLHSVADRVDSLSHKVSGSSSGNLDFTFNDRIFKDNYFEFPKSLNSDADDADKLDKKCQERLSCETCDFYQNPEISSHSLSSLKLYRKDLKAVKVHQGLIARPIRGHTSHGLSLSARVPQIWPSWQGAALPPSTREMSNESWKLLANSALGMTSQVSTPQLRAPEQVEVSLENRPVSQDFFHEVTVKPATDPVTNRPAMLITQHDITVYMQKESALTSLARAQLTLLSESFPRHILEFLSKSSVEDVPSHMGQLARSHSNVTILFMDVAGFTAMSKDVSPRAVLTMLNELFTRFDALADIHGVQKVDTAGDSYIAACGVLEVDNEGFIHAGEENFKDPVESAHRIMAFAIDMLLCAKEVTMPHNGQAVSIRIGIHTGECVSGLVGTKLPKFSIFGDTMNTASRMESTGQLGRIQVSSGTKELLDTVPDSTGGLLQLPIYDWQRTGGVQVKGKGLMDTYLWVPPEDWDEKTQGMMAESVLINPQIAPDKPQPVSSCFRTDIKQPSELSLNIANDSKQEAASQIMVETSHNIHVLGALIRRAAIIRGSTSPLQTNLRRMQAFGSADAELNSPSSTRNQSKSMDSEIAESNSTNHLRTNARKDSIPVLLPELFDKVRLESSDISTNLAFGTNWSSPPSSDQDISGSGSKSLQIMVSTSRLLVSKSSPKTTRFASLQRS